MYTDKLTTVTSAAIYGLRNKANVSIFILHPKGRVSPIQEAQMTTVTDPNVHNIAVQGTFDDCQVRCTWVQSSCACSHFISVQDIVKSLFADREFNAIHRLGAVNSINWARILAQTVYYFLSYFHLRRQVPDRDVEIQYVVPTGNFGDILAGYYAKRMGLPVGRLGVATNANDILARFWQSGAYEKVDSSAAPGQSEPAAGASDGKQAADASGVKETLSPAMDILVSSNFERLLWYLAFETAEGADAAERKQQASATIAEWMGKVKSNGRVQVPVATLELARKEFFAERVSDEQVCMSVASLRHRTELLVPPQTLETIKYYFESDVHYIADPHTAVGLRAARNVAPQKSVILRFCTVAVCSTGISYCNAVPRTSGRSSCRLPIRQSSPRP